MPPRVILELAAAKAEEKAKEILSEYGYHSGNVIDYDMAVDIIATLPVKK